jgi:hypothetical protein
MHQKQPPPKIAVCSLAIAVDENMASPKTANTPDINK